MNEQTSISTGDVVAVIVDVSRTFGAGDDAVHVLAPISLTLRAGTIAVLAGPSGSGKTTLCNLILGWDTPSTGTIELRLGGGSWAQRSSAPQRLALIEHLSVHENLLLPTWTAGLADRSPTVADLAEVLDIAHLLGRSPGELSFGEQQRVAVARALVGAPGLAVLDEPTGHQDEEHALAVLTALAIARDAGSCVLVSTHDPALLEIADEVTVLEAP